MQAFPAEAVHPRSANIGRPCASTSAEISRASPHTGIVPQEIFSCSRSLLQLLLLLVLALLGLPGRAARSSCTSSGARGAAGRGDAGALSAMCLGADISNSKLVSINVAPEQASHACTTCVAVMHALRDGAAAGGAEPGFGVCRVSILCRPRAHNDTSGQARPCRRAALVLSAFPCVRPHTTATVELDDQGSPLDNFLSLRGRQPFRKKRKRHAKTFWWHI